MDKIARAVTHRDILHGEAEELRRLTVQPMRALSGEEVADLEPHCRRETHCGSRIKVEWIDGRACWLQILEKTIELGGVDNYGLYGYENGSEEPTNRIDFLGSSPITKISLLDGSENGRVIYDLRRDGLRTRTETGPEFVYLLRAAHQKSL